MTQTGISRASDEGLVSVIIFAIYWLGLWTPLTWSRRDTRRRLKDGLEDLRQWWKGATVLVSPRGIVVRLDGARGFYRHSAVKAATLEKGLVVLWLVPASARAIICIPVRLLEPGQEDLLLSFGRPSGMLK
jgi:hypothetical protein